VTTKSPKLIKLIIMHGIEIQQVIFEKAPGAAAGGGVAKYPDESASGAPSGILSSN
jgi:hypothetical protein